jgi:hypothetical protein
MICTKIAYRKPLLRSVFFILTVLVLHDLTAQNVPTALSEKDSLFFSQPYPYILPIMGSKAHKAKIRLPYPVGVMFNTLVGTQNLTLSDLELGFGRFSNPDRPNMIGLDEVVVFEDISAQTSTYNMRVDTWLLPFLNVYGIVGQTKKADINVKLLEPIPLNVVTEVSGTYLGYGVMGAGAVGPLFFSLDANQTWSFNERLDEPARVFISGLRVGPVFRFANNPDMNITLWTGAMYSSLNGETRGRIAVEDLAPDAPGAVDNLIVDLDNWYDDLGPVEQVVFENLYNNLRDGLTEISGALTDGYIEYGFTKTINNPWNMLVGAQWQINYRWQVRAEAQFLGDRTAGLFSLNYRFGIRGNNWLSN